MTSIIPFQQLADLCLRKGINQAIICPGSRSAALTIAFTNTKGMNCQSVSDERSAAFIAMGKSLESGNPTILICTSGTAALNFAPAVAEAFFRKIPIVILTADRPPEWIHQHDGQTVFQANCFGKHVHKFYEWLPDQSMDSIQYAVRISNEGINTSIKKRGPVHFNIPIREPFYPSEISLNVEPWRNISQEFASDSLSQSTISAFEKCLLKSQKRLLLLGQMDIGINTQVLKEFATKFGFTVIGDCISNFPEGVKNQDYFLKKVNENLKPDFLISVGESTISKALKLFLRKHKAKVHWHISQETDIIDPFVSITNQFNFVPEQFMEQMMAMTKGYPNLDESWHLADQEAGANLNAFWAEKKEFSDISIVYEFLKSIPENSILHLGNSMTVRYFNSLQQFIPNNTNIHCNRGTSGIDGILSTAVGHALNTDKMIYCILGDMSFQYDKNALWNNILPANLKILILNNNGGVIFQMIKGPKSQKSFEEFFRTHQTNKAELIAVEFGLSYYSAKNSEEVIDGISKLINEKGPAILEAFTSPDIDERVFKSMFE